MNQKTKKCFVYIDRLCRVVSCCMLLFLRVFAIPTPYFVWCFYRNSQMLICSFWLYVSAYVLPLTLSLYLSLRCIEWFVTRFLRKTRSTAIGIINSHVIKFYEPNNIYIFIRITLGKPNTHPHNNAVQDIKSNLFSFGTQNKYVLHINMKP